MTVARSTRARAAAALIIAGFVLGVSACSSSSSPAVSVPAVATPNPSTTVPATDGPPHLATFLALPVAQPAHCTGTDAVSDGRASPWDTTADINVFLKSHDTPAEVASVGAQLKAQPIVATLYFETKQQSYAEFQRLYTCSGDVSPTALPASWRVVLTPGTTYGQRNTLVGQEQLAPGVSLVSCPPEATCANIVRSVDPSIIKTVGPSAQPGSNSPTPISTSTTLPGGAKGQAQASS